MGYYTNYSLKIYNTDGGLETDDINCKKDAEEVIQYAEDYNKDVVKFIKKIKNNEDCCYGILYEECCKWYDYESELTDLSKSFPNLVFCLTGEGEEQGDVWTQYFYNGNSYQIRPELKWPKVNIKEWCEKVGK